MAVTVAIAVGVTAGVLAKVILPLGEVVAIDVAVVVEIGGEAGA